MYNEIQDYIQKNEDSTVVETIQHFDKEFENETTLIGLVANAGYKETYAQWTALTTQEKILVASDLVAAALTKTTQTKAFEYTQAEYGKNGLGDKSDAFRHAIWNALMCRYIDKVWASAFATAHESGKSATELKKKAADGYTEAQHRTLDLHNNQKGRDCWLWNSGFAWTSNTDLLKRVREKMKNKQLTWLHS